MAAVGSDLESVELSASASCGWTARRTSCSGRLRSECPMHWTERLPGVSRRGRLLVGDDRRGHPHRQPRLADLLLRTGGITAVSGVFPLELVRAMFIGMDPPKHDRLKALFQAGFTPKRIAAHEDAIRTIVRDVLDRLRRPSDMRSRQRRRPAGRLTRDRQLHGHPRAGRRDLGEADELDARSWRPRPQPRRNRRRARERHPRDLRALPAADRRAPRPPDRRSDERARARRGRRAEARGARDRDGLLPAGRRRQRQHQGDLLQRHARADGRPRADADRCSTTPRSIPSAVEESLRMFPAFAHFRRTATCDTELHGQKIREGEKVVMWYVSSNRDETRYEDPDRFDVRRNPEHQAFGAGGRHFCLGTALARLELRIMLEETLARYPQMQLAGTPTSWNPLSSISSSRSPSGSRPSAASRTALYRRIGRRRAKAGAARAGVRACVRCPPWTHRDSCAPSGCCCAVACRGPRSLRSAQRRPGCDGVLPGTLTRTESDALMSASSGDSNGSATGFGQSRFRASSSVHRLRRAARARRYRCRFAPAVEIGWRLARPYWGRGSPPRPPRGYRLRLRTARAARDRLLHRRRQPALAAGDGAPRDAS